MQAGCSGSDHNWGRTCVDMCGQAESASGGVNVATSTAALAKTAKSRTGEWMSWRPWSTKSWPNSRASHSSTARIARRRDGGSCIGAFAVCDLSLRAGSNVILVYLAYFSTIFYICLLLKTKQGKSGVVTWVHRGSSTHPLSSSALESIEDRTDWYKVKVCLPPLMIMKSLKLWWVTEGDKKERTLSASSPSFLFGWLRCCPHLGSFGFESLIGTEIQSDHGSGCRELPGY